MRIAKRVGMISEHFRDGLGEGAFCTEVRGTQFRLFAIALSARRFALRSAYLCTYELILLLLNPPHLP